MPDYSTGKIYKVINPQNEIIYIGSTTQKLSSRFCNHEHKGNGNKIILLENYPCNSREELNKKEQEIIDHFDNLLNIRNAYIPEYKEYFKEYSKENKEKILQHKKKYYEENKKKQKVYYDNNIDKISEYRKVYYQENKIKIICECGCEIGKYDNKHKKTKKHIKLMESK